MENVDYDDYIHCYNQSRSTDKTLYENNFMKINILILFIYILLFIYMLCAKRKRNIAINCNTTLRNNTSNIIQNSKNDPFLTSLENTSPIIPLLSFLPIITKRSQKNKPIKSITDTNKIYENRNGKYDTTFENLNSNIFNSNTNNSFDMVKEKTFTSFQSISHI